MEYDKNFIINISSGFMGTFLLSAACEIKLFDALSDGSKTVEQLAEKTGTDSEQLIRILRPLAVYKLISRDNNGMYSLEKSGRMLISTDAGSMWGYAVFCGREAAKVWGRLGQALIEKRSLREFSDSGDMFEKQDKESFEIFDGMMKNVSSAINLSGFFNEFGNKNTSYHIVDIGGGTGTIIAKFLNYYTKSTGVIIDLEQAKDNAEINIETLGLKDRCRFKSGNFFNNIDVKGDIVILSRVLHDWNDENALKILKNIVGCLNDNSRLLIIENIMTETTERNALATYMNDIQMWGFCDSKERTEQEFNKLFMQSGLEIEKIYQASPKSSVYVISVRKNNIEEGEI